MSNRKFKHNEIIAQMIRDALVHPDKQEAFSDLTFELVRAISYLVGCTPDDKDRDAFVKEINTQIMEGVEMLEEIRQEEIRQEEAKKAGVLVA